MSGGAKAHHDGIVAFSQTDFTDDLKEVEVPVLVMHGDETRSCLCRLRAAVRQAAEHGSLKTYKGFPHGMITSEAETINVDLLAFLES